ncbi:hypothetical protein [Rhodospirillum centenum]|uniref:hypothetical protein n=1 Tax=Rhodospirillum centenum TaxID=34018 RepID=UPI0002F122D1|nr:hypothetical protein [Rhodospirillum centenum]
MVSSVVIPLRRPVQHQTKSWANQELAEFYRVVEILNRAGLAVSIDSGWSDEGDPWLVFLRDDSSEVIAHFAKIDGRLVASNGATGDTIRGSNFRDLLNALVRMQPLVLPPASPATAKLYLHPSVILSAFVAAALMLLSDASPAEASEASADPGPGGDDAAQVREATPDPETMIRPVSGHVIPAVRAFDGQRQWEALRSPTSKADSIFTQAQFAALTAVLGTAMMLLDQAGDVAGLPKTEAETAAASTGPSQQTGAEAAPTEWAVAALGHDEPQKPILTETSSAPEAAPATASDSAHALSAASLSSFLEQETAGDVYRSGIDSVRISDDTIVVSHDLLNVEGVAFRAHDGVATEPPVTLETAPAIVFLTQGGLIEVRIVPVLAEILLLNPGKAVEVEFDILLDTVAASADVAPPPASPDAARERPVSSPGAAPEEMNSDRSDDAGAKKVADTPAAQTPDQPGSPVPTPPSDSSSPSPPADSGHPTTQPGHPLPEAPQATVPHAPELAAFGKIILADGSSDYLLTAGRETIVFTGGQVTLFNFQFGTDRLIIETSNINPSSMEITWSDQGSLIMTFDDNSKLTFVGITGWENPGG